MIKPRRTKLASSLRRPFRLGRWSWIVVAGFIVGWAVSKAGVDPRVAVNPRGWSQVQAFFSAMFRPDLSHDILELALKESVVTVGYAIVGTALAILIGSLGGLLMTERLWSPISGPMKRGRFGWSLGRLVFAVPRSMHEVVFGLILVKILGLNPLVAVLAIGLPFGAVTAKVFAELIDAVPTSSEMTLRASGAGRLPALLIATVPQALPDLLSYAFYRLECSLRSAAVLGIVGAGGLGFQLALSFQSLRYNQMWTFLWALIFLSGMADRWSSLIRRRRNSAVVETKANKDRNVHEGADGEQVTKWRLRPHRQVEVGKSTKNGGSGWFLRFSFWLWLLGVPLAVWHLDLDPSTFWAPRAKRLANDFVVDAWPPQVGTGGLQQLVEDSVDTIALAVLSIVIASLLAWPLAFLAQRMPGKKPTTSVCDRSASGSSGYGRLVLSVCVRFFLLVARSVPPPVWAFIIVFVLFPGLWPGAVALGVYNAGILGRLQAEIIENYNHRPAEALMASGASSFGALIYATVPAVSGRFIAHTLYRWEVVIRETVIVGVVGAAGLGRRLDEQASAFNYDGILATILALLVVTIAADFASASLRRSLR